MSEEDIMNIQRQSARSQEMVMCSRSVFSKIVTFVILFILFGILQLLFNAAYIIMVGRFVVSEFLCLFL